MKKQNKNSEQPNGTQIAAIAERMANRKAFAEIKDPAKWQKEIRKDRPLPGRN